MALSDGTERESRGVGARRYVSHITVRDKVRVVKVVRGNSSKRVKGIEIWLMSIFKMF